MKFEITGRPEKLLWNNVDKTAFLYAVLDDQNEGKKFTVFTQSELIINSSYKLKGSVSVTIDKKRKDEHGKSIYQTSFNADDITKF